MQRLVLPVRAAEHLQRSILEPLLRQHLARRLGKPVLHELEQRALAQRQRGHRAGLEVLMRADPRAVDPATRLSPLPIEVDQAGVQSPPLGQIRAGVEAAGCRFHARDQGLQRRGKRLCANAAIRSSGRGPVVLEAGELPVVQPVDGPQQPPRRLPLTLRSVVRVAVFPEWMQRPEPIDDARSLFGREEVRIVVMQRTGRHRIDRGRAGRGGHSARYHDSGAPGLALPDRMRVEAA